MKTKRVLWAILALLLVSTMLFTACKPKAEEEVVEEAAPVEEVAEAEEVEETGLPDLGGKEVTVAVENAYLPFNYIDPKTGEPAGWDYDVWNEICVLLNCTPVFVEAAWEGMIQAVADGQFDAAGDGITITEDRAEIVDFSVGYINLDQRLLVREDENRFESIEDIVANEEFKLGTQTGTTNYDTAKDYLPEERIQAFEQFPFAVQALIAGDIDAVIIDEVAGQGYLGENAELLKLVGPSMSSDQLGFIFPLGSELVGPVNEAIKTLAENGFLDEINKVYFGPDFNVTYDDLFPPDEEEAVDGPTITVWADDTRSSIILALADDFAATYGVNLVVEEVASIRDNFVVAAPAGEGPDIFIGAHDWLGQVVASGLVLPIDLGDKAASFTAVSIEGCTFAGELYCMPYATENLGFFYNTDLIETPPTTWEEAVEMGQALIDSGDVTYGMALSGTTYDAFPIMTSFGGYIFGQDDAGNYDPSDVGVDGEGMIAAGEWISAQVASGWMSDNTDWDTAHVLFETGEIPFLMAGPWALDRLDASGVPYAITNFPSGGRPFAGVQAFFINSFSENTLLAQAFLTEFIATEEVMTELLEVGHRASAYKPVFEATEDANLAAIGLAGAEAMLMPAIPEMGSVWGSWGDAFALIIQSGEEPADALATAGAQIRELLAGALAGMVNAPGSWQAAAGCEGDWDPACEVTALTEGDDGMYTGTFELPAGDYEAKIALDGSWALNYGVGGTQDGDNYPFSLAADGTVTFTYDPETHVLTIATE